MHYRMLLGMFAAILLAGWWTVTSAAQVACRTTDTVRVSANAECSTDSGMGVGLGSALERRIIRAVNLFGSGFSVENPATVCLQGTGALYLSRSNLNPRMAFFAWYYVTEDGYTCTNVDVPSTVILVDGRSPLAPGQPPETIGEAFTPSSPAPATAGSTPAAPAAGAAVGGQIVFTNCQVVTRAILNFRDAPSLNSNVIELIPFRTILRAINRSGDWFNVIYGSNNGWVAASLVDTRGRCQ